VTHRVIFSPEALQQLSNLLDYIARRASPAIAMAYTDGIVSYFESLSTFPQRGTQRDDVRPGLRITNYKKRAVIAFAVTTEEVLILGVFYGGQDYETLLQDDADNNTAH
jgi:plasmid stabilization system protein ParE